MKCLILCIEGYLEKIELWVVGRRGKSNCLLIYFIGLFPKTNSQQVRFTLKTLIQGSHHSYCKGQDPRKNHHVKLKS